MSGEHVSLLRPEKLCSFEPAFAATSTSVGSNATGNDDVVFAA
jgi:hypothetical protein